MKSRLVRYFFAAIFFLELIALASATHLTIESNSNRPTADSCELVDHHGQNRYVSGTLSPFWGQEMVGAPEARAALEVHAKNGVALTTPTIGIIEGGMAKQGLLGPTTARLDDDIKAIQPSYCEHAHCVTNLINAKGPVGVGSGSADRFSINSPGSDAFRYLADSPPQLINISQVRRGGRWNEAALNQITSKSIVVWAAGNTSSETLVEFPKGGEIVSVASVTPWGGPSEFTTEGPGVTIAAPGDYPILTSHDGRNMTGFGGTSGAAPVVTGALSNVVAILGSVTAREAKLLLEKTAIPSANRFQNPRRNGAGTVNALKLVEVAARLKQRGWPARRADLINDNSLYDFSVARPNEERVNAGQLLESGTLLLRNPSCDRRREGLGKVRQAFLLASGTETESALRIFHSARNLLAQTLESQGLTSNASFYRAMDRNGLRDVLEHRLARIRDSHEIWAIARSLAFVPLNEATALIERGIRSNTLQTALNAVHLLSNFPRAIQLADIAFQHPNIEVRRMVIDRVCRIPVQRALLERALQDPDATIRQTAADRLAGRTK